MTSSAALFDRLERAVRRAVAADEIGAARSLRLHVGAPIAELPPMDALLSLGDAIFACGRTRLERAGGTPSGNTVLCVWENGQVATISAFPSMRPLVVMTVLGSAGALHFQQGGT